MAERYQSARLVSAGSISRSLAERPAPRRETGAPGWDPRRRLRWISRCGTTRLPNQTLGEPLASSSDEIANFLDVGLCPRPAICGNTNHIQWLALRPHRSSPTAREYVP